MVRLRTPQDIATTILAVDLFPAEDGRPTETFEKHLTEGVDPTEFSFVSSPRSIRSDPFHPSRNVLVSQQSYDTLLQTLRALREGSRELDAQQRNVLTNSGNLVELMAKESDDLKRIRHDEIAHDEARGYTTPENKADHDDMIQYHQHVANTLRKQVIPQLEALTTKLRIPFDKPQGLG